MQFVPESEFALPKALQVVSTERLLLQEAMAFFNLPPAKRPSPLGTLCQERKRVASALVYELGCGRNWCDNMETSRGKREKAAVRTVAAHSPFSPFEILAGCISSRTHQ